MFVDDDSNSDDDAFEIGIANANKKSLHKFNYLQDDDDLMDSFSNPSHRGGAAQLIAAMPGIDSAVADVSTEAMNDFLSQQANRRRIQTANKHEGFTGKQNYDNKRPTLGSQSSNHGPMSKPHYVEKQQPPSTTHGAKQIRTVSKPKSAAGYRINQSKAEVS